MGQFLRDQLVKNVSIDEATLDRLKDAFEARVALLNVGVLEDAPGRAVLFYIIRFDEKGYRFVDFDDVKKCFREARHVKRLVFTVDSALHRNSGAIFGTHCDLRIDAKDEKACWLTVTADSKDWVDVTVVNITEVLADQKTLSGLVRTPWSGLIIQLAGVLVGFVLSLWAALKVAPFLNIDNAFVVTLFFALLIYSNVWGYTNAQITKVVDFSFPNVRFKRAGKDWLHLAVQTAGYPSAIAPRAPRAQYGRPARHRSHPCAKWPRQIEGT
jgi:hypothetical protein